MNIPSMLASTDVQMLNDSKQQFLTVTVRKCVHNKLPEVAVPRNATCSNKIAVTQTKESN
jgi:hypothetical protein